MTTVIIVLSVASYLLVGMLTGRASWRRYALSSKNKYGQHWKENDSNIGDAYAGAWSSMIFWPLVWAFWLVWVYPVRAMTRDEERGILPSWRLGGGNRHS